MPRNKLPEDAFAEDACVWGLVCGQKDYTLAFHLNQLLGISLERKADAELELKKKNRLLLFSRYHYADPMNDRSLALFSNKYQGEFLIPEIKPADYLLLLRGYWDADEKKHLLQLLRKNEPIQAVVEPEWNKLKSRENLIFDE